MANLQDYYYQQLVLSNDLDTLQTNLQAADHQLMVDQEYTGVISGYHVVEKAGTPDLTVDVQGPGLAYDQQGNRVAMPSLLNLDLSVDSNGSPTEVLGVGGSRWVSVFIVFERIPSDLRLDGNDLPVNFRNDEGFVFFVEQGADAPGSPTRPALRNDALLIADVLISFGQTQILNVDIESRDVVTKPNSRFQFIFNLTASSPLQVRSGSLPNVLQDVLSEVNDHITGAGTGHTAAAIEYDDTVAGAKLPGDDVQEALDYIGVNYARLTGADQVVVASTEFSQRVEMLSGAFIRGDITGTQSVAPGRALRYSQHIGQAGGDYDDSETMLFTFAAAFKGGGIFSTSFFQLDYPFTSHLECTLMLSRSDILVSEQYIRKVNYTYKFTAPILCEQLFTNQVYENSTFGLEASAGLGISVNTQGLLSITSDGGNLTQDYDVIGSFKLTVLDRS